MILSLLGFLILGANLEIDISQLPQKSDKFRIEPKPWSGHWWPAAEGQLWKWSDSPLRKFDLYRKKKEREGLASKWESKRSEDSQNKNGYRREWSLAAALTREPKHPVLMLIDNELVEFSIGDIKALQTLTFSAPHEMKQETTLSSPQLMLELIDQFHKQKKQVFWMDWNPSEEVWMVPVYASYYEMESISNQPDAVKLHLRLEFVDILSDYDDRDSAELKDRSVDYYAVLKGQRNGDKLIIETGQWVSESLSPSKANHPDNFFSLEDFESFQRSRKSSNPYVDIDLVEEIAARSY